MYKSEFLDAGFERRWLDTEKRGRSVQSPNTQIALFDRLSGGDSVPKRCGLRIDQWSDTSNYSNAKIRFQSFFMLITVQSFFFASSYSSGVNVPTLVSGKPFAGP
jgi:hypothetical protein